MRNTGTNKLAAHRRGGRVNSRLALGLLAFLVVSGVAIHVLHGRMLKKNARDLLDRSERLLAEAEAMKDSDSVGESAEDREKRLKGYDKKRRDAVRYLRQYLQLEPDDTEAWVTFAHTSDEVNTQPRQRLEVLERYSAALRRLEALDSDEQRSQIQEMRRRVVEIAVLLARYNPTDAGRWIKIALQEIATLEENDAKLSNDSELLLVKGQCLEVQGKWNEAAEMFDKAMRSEPEKLEGYLALIRMVLNHAGELGQRELTTSSYRDYDPSNRQDPSIRMVTDGIAEQMAKFGKPRYRALMSQAHYYQIEAKKATEEQARLDDLTSAKEKIVLSVEAQRALLEETTDTKNAEDSDEIDSKTDPKTDIQPELFAASIFQELAQIRYQSGDVQAGAELMKGAREYAESANKRAPTKPDSYSVLARLEIIRVNQEKSPDPDYTQALKYLRDGLDQVRDSDDSHYQIKRELGWLLANQLIISGDWSENPQKGDRTPEFQDLILRLREWGTPPEHIEYLEVRMKLDALQKADTPAQAGVVVYKLIDQLEALHTKLIGNRNLSVQIDYILAYCFGILGDVDGQFRVYDRAARLDPLSPDLRYRLAFVLNQLGRTKEAIEKIQISSLAIPGVAATLAQLQLKQQLELPRDARQWNRVSSIYDNTLAGLEKLDQKHSSDWTAVKLRQAKIHSYQALELADQDPKAADEQIQKGEQVLRAAIAEDPQEPKYWSELAAFGFLRAKLEPDEVLSQNVHRLSFEVLDEAEKQLGPQAEFQVMRARLLSYLERNALANDEKNETKPEVRAERRRKAIQAIAAQAQDPERFRESGENGADQRPELWRGVGLALSDLGEIDASRELWEKLVESQPANLSHRLFLMELAISDIRLQLRRVDGDQPTPAEWDRSLSQIAKIVEGIRTYEGPSGPYGNYSEGMRLLMELAVDKKQGKSELREQVINQARGLLSSAATQRPNFATIERGLGHLEELAGNEAAASEHYRHAINLGDMSPSTVNRAVMLLANQNRDQEVIDIVEKVKQHSPDMLEIQGGLTAFPGMGELAAMAAIREGKLEMAVDLYNDVDPEHQSYRYHLRVGQVNLLKARRNKSVAQANDIEKYFRKATELAPQEANTWIQLISYLLEAGRAEDAQQEVERVKDQLKHEFRHLVLARLYLALRNRSEAEVQYEAALKQHPDDLRVIEHAAEFFRLIGKTERATEIIQQALASNHDGPVVHTVAARFYTAAGERELARKYLQKILDVGEKAGEARLKTARRTMALLVASSGTYADYQTARKFLQPNLDVERPELDDLKALISILAPQPTREAKLEQIKVFNQIAERQSLGQQQKLQLAKLYEETGNWREARSLLLTLATSDNHRVFYISHFVRSLRRHNEFAEAEVWLRQLKSMMPNSYLVAILEAEYLAAQEEGDKALQVIQNYLDREEEIVTPEQTFQDLVAEGRIEEALAPLEKYIESSNDQVAGQILAEAKMLLQKELSEEAAIVLRRILQRSELRQSMQEAKYRLAAASLAGLGEYQSAEIVYRQYMKLRNNPNDVQGLVALLAKQQGRIEEALDLCDKLWETAPPELVARISMVVLRSGNPTAEQIQRVGKRLESALHDNPHSNSLLTRLASFYDLQGRFSETEKIYTRAVEQNPRNVTALNNLAWILVMQDKEAKRALELINAAINLAGPRAELLDTRGVVLIKLGKFDEAITDLKGAAEGSSSPPAKRFHLAEAYLGKGRTNYELARTELEEAVKAGLTEDSLHPLEIPTFQRLLRELKVSFDSSKRG